MPAAEKHTHVLRPQWEEVTPSMHSLLCVRPSSMCAVALRVTAIQRDTGSSAASALTFALRLLLSDVHLNS